MSGFIGILASASDGKIISPLGFGVAIGVSIAFDPATGKLQINSDGSISYIGTTDLDPNPNRPPAWYSPITAGIGSAFWVRATLTGGTLTSTNTGTWIPLSSNVAFVKGPNSSASAATATLTLEFATDASGTNIVLTSTGWQVGYMHN